MRRWRFFEAVPPAPSPDERLQRIHTLATNALYDPFVYPLRDALRAIAAEAKGGR